MTNEVQKMQVLLYHMEDTDVNPSMPSCKTMNPVDHSEGHGRTIRLQYIKLSVGTLKNIFQEGELNEKWLLHFCKYHSAWRNGRKNTKPLGQFYNLDAIISVGYRVNSHRATQFRIWATKVPK